MKKLCCLLALACLFKGAIAQSAPARTAGPARPKLVVGIVIDQMRWDFLYRYYDRYKADGGFRRMMTKASVARIPSFLMRLH